MKIFISYGRDIKPFADLVRQELIRLGHEVWIDSSEISAGEDWRERITTGIQESDQVLAFMSSHGLRKGGVCLDELAIAVSCGRKTIRTFIMEPGIEDLIPSTVRRIQYYDLSEYSSVTPEELPSWFDSVKGELIEFIVNRDSQDHEWIEVLEARLNPDKLRGREIVSLRQMFQNRAWIDELIDDWVSTKGDDNIMLLSGFPGFGKSCYCINYFHYNPYVVSLSLCEWADSSEEGIKRLIRNIAFDLAVHLPSYGKRLLWITDEYSDRISTMDAERLFKILIIEPLITEIDGGHDPVIMIIDGIDKLTREGDNLLADIIADNIGLLPDFLNIFISTRSDKSVFRTFSSSRKVEFNPGNPHVNSDISAYMSKRLSEFISDGLIDDNGIRVLTEKCAGSFMMARLLSDGIIKGTIRRQDIDRLPEQISDLFFQCMHRIIPDGDVFAEKYYDAFSILAAAEMPVSAAFLRKCLGWRKSEFMSFLRKFSIILLENRDDPEDMSVSLFNNTFRRWMCDENGSADVYLADPEEGLELICSGYISLLEDGAIPDRELANAMTYLMNAGRKKDLRRFCADTDVAEQILRSCRLGLESRETYMDSLSLLSLYRKAVSASGAEGETIARIVNSEIPYLIASGCFNYGNLLAVESELEGAIGNISSDLGRKEYLESLYMLGTAEDWLGRRDRSVETFKLLNAGAAACSADDPAAADADDYRIKALTGLIWNDHFTHAEEGMERLRELKTMQPGTRETELSKFLIEARLLLTAGKLKEAMDMYNRAAEMAGDEIWGYDSISVRNQMLMLEILVACYDNEDYAAGAELGEKIYARLQGHWNIPECYCASWIAANCLKIGLYDKSEKYLKIAEEISGGTSKPRSAWISMHLKSIRAFLDGEQGKVSASLEGHLGVIGMARECSDDWVLGDACYEYLQLSLLSGSTDDSEIGRVAQILRETAENSGLPHLVFKNRLIRMVMGREEPDEGFIADAASSDYSSTDSIQVLYLLYTFIEQARPMISDRLKRKVRSVYASNSDAGFAERLGIRRIMEELDFGLHD